MKKNITRLFGLWTLFQRFTLVSFAFMVVGMVVIGRWVSEQIKTRVISETASTTALYMDSFIAPNIQELSSTGSLTPGHIAILEKLFTGTDFGRHIVTLKVWDRNGRILFSDNPKLIGSVFPSGRDVEIAYTGEVVAEISNLDEAEHVEERLSYKRLLQIYSPIRQDGTNQIIAVAEFYQTVDALEGNISKAQRQSWIIVSLSMAGIYLFQLGFVRSADRTIRQQKDALAIQVTQLTELLARNEELNQRVKRAAANSTELNERFLRRISAELHDGPVQDLALAMLRLDRVIGQSEICRATNLNTACHNQLPEIQNSLDRSMQEIREISRGLGIPQLENMSLPEILQRVVNAHKRRTNTTATLECQGLPDQANLPFKITVFRFVQEGLNNAFHHAYGKGQRVLVTYANRIVHIAVSDEGPGFDPSQPIDWEEHLGLAGMRERVESMGGDFEIKSDADGGTIVMARIPLQADGIEN